MIKQHAAPESLSEAIRYFADPNVSFEFMVKMRWPKGVICPACEAANPSFLKTRRIWKCRDCKRQFSVKLGTVFEDSPLGLNKWLPALWMLANCRNGISSYELARDLKVTQKLPHYCLCRPDLRHFHTIGVFPASSASCFGNGACAGANQQKPLPMPHLLRRIRTSKDRQVPTRSSPTAFSRPSSAVKPRSARRWAGHLPVPATAAPISLPMSGSAAGIIRRCSRPQKARRLSCSSRSLFSPHPPQAGSM